MPSCLAGTRKTAAVRGALNQWDGSPEGENVGAISGQERGKGTSECHGDQNMEAPVSPGSIGDG